MRAPFAAALLLIASAAGALPFPDPGDGEGRSGLSSAAESPTSPDSTSDESAAPAPAPAVQVKPIDTPASAAEESSREDEMFGAAPPDSETALPEPSPSSSDGRNAPPAPRDADTERLKPVDVGSMDSALAAANDRLAVGARLFVQGQLSQYESSPPQGMSELQAPSLLDVYLDGRRGDRVRAYARGRLSFDPMTPSGGTLGATGQTTGPLQTQLDQLWVNFDLQRRVFVTLGKMRVKWGSGRFWNPTDFLNKQRLDPLAILDQRLGTGLVKLHVPVESLGWNFYALADVQDATRPDEIGGALRGEFVFGPGEATLSAAARRNNPLRLGADLSLGVWLVDLHAELAVQHGLKTPFYRGTLDPANGMLPEAFTRELEWIPQATVGGEVSLQYSDQDSIFLGAEYFFNDAGYDGSSLYTWLLAGTAAGPVDARSGAATALPPPGLFVPLYLGRHYAAAYASLPNPGDWNNTSFMLAALANLSDGTGLVRFTYSVLVLTYMNVTAFANVHWGGNGEFHFAPVVPAGLGAGTVPEIPAPAYEIGAALTVSM